MRLNKGWYSLLLVPVGIICLPILFIAMMMGTRLLSIFVGPINIWNTTRSVPPIEAISGHYQLSDVTSEVLE